jgi:hypothetical protein
MNFIFFKYKIHLSLNMYFDPHLTLLKRNRKIIYISSKDMYEGQIIHEPEPLKLKPGTPKIHCNCYYNDIELFSTLYNKKDRYLSFLKKEKSPKHRFFEDRHKIHKIHKIHGHKIHKIHGHKIHGHKIHEIIGHKIHEIIGHKIQRKSDFMKFLRKLKRNIH